MCCTLFEQLTSDAFALSAACISTPQALRQFLVRSAEVRDVREALRQGTITDETIRRFVSSLMRGFRVGQHFEHEIALAALAVALEKRPTDFAEEFLLDLAKLQLAEMPLCIRVARECLRQRTTMAWNKGRDVQLSPWPERVSFCKVKAVPPRSSSEIHTINERIEMRPTNAKA